MELGFAWFVTAGAQGQLLPRLESIKHYFLLDRGDFFEHLLDCAESELDKVIPQVRKLLL